MPKNPANVYNSDLNNIKFDITLRLSNPSFIMTSDIPATFKNPNSVAIMTHPTSGAHNYYDYGHDGVFDY